MNEQRRDALPPGARLDGDRYEIERDYSFRGQNGTAYLVMDFEDGLPLDTFLAKREAQGEPLTEAERTTCWRGW